MPLLQCVLTKIEYIKIIINPAKLKIFKLSSSFCQFYLIKTSTNLKLLRKVNFEKSYDVTPVIYILKIWNKNFFLSLLHTAKTFYHIIQKDSLMKINLV